VLLSIVIDGCKLKKIIGNKIDFWITVHEGKYHLIRKLCGVIGINIIHLTQTKFGQYN